MAYKSNKSNKHNKEFISKNTGSITTASKFKPVLVKDLLRSFEKPNPISEDLTQCKKNTSKTDGTYQKIHKRINDEGSLQTFTSKQLKMASNVDQSNLNNTKSVSSEMQNLNAVPHNCNKVQCSYSAVSQPDLDLKSMVGVVQNVVIQLKAFLEQSLQAHEDQTSKLKQILNNVNDINNAINLSESNNHFSARNKGNVSEVAVQTENSSKTSLESAKLNLSSSLQSDDKNSNENNINSQEKNERRLPLIKLVSNGDSNQDLLGKTGIETDYSKYYKSELLTPMSITRCRTVAAESCSKFQDRRRSLSTPSEFDVTQGSFTMLEKKLNIVHKLQTNSLPISPMQISTSTPTFAMHWDKRFRRPLKEYMTLKEKSDFLVTPNVSWLRLDP